jgi:hypothetical protein
MSSLRDTNLSDYPSLQSKENLELGKHDRLHESDQVVDQTTNLSAFYNSFLESYKSGNPSGTLWGLTGT